MQDRLSTYPGRIRLIPVQGQENTYDIERADEPSQLGTELKTDTLLSDTTAALLGLDASTGTPNAAFGKLKSLLNTVAAQIGPKEIGSYVGTGVYGTTNRNKLTFDFEPKILFLEDLCIVRGATNLGSIYFGWSGKTVYWWSSQGALAQKNADGFTYHYAAIGWDESDDEQQDSPSVSIVDDVLVVS